MNDIEKCLAGKDEPSLPELKRSYRHAVHLCSQLLSAIYDQENFSASCHAPRSRLAEEQAGGARDGDAVILMIHEPLPSMKRLTEAIEEHWKEMLHAAIKAAAQQGKLPYFEKALVKIEITTPRGSDNSRLWDTSNRAINIVINNLKGIFFEDDNMEHMAFLVAGRWGEEGSTVIRISEYDDTKRVSLRAEGPEIHDI